MTARRVPRRPSLARLRTALHRSCSRRRPGELITLRAHAAVTRFRVGAPARTLSITRLVRTPGLGYRSTGMALALVRGGGVLLVACLAAACSVTRQRVDFAVR